MNHVDKNRPSQAWIDSLRARFPCEKEIDRILTRKMQRRAGPPYAPVSLETLVAGTEALLRSELKDGFEIVDARWLSGGASKLQMEFKLNWNQPGVGRTTARMVLRMEPSESICETSRLREFQIIKAMEDVVPVPAAYWVDPDGQYLPYPAIVYGFATGVTKPSAASSGVTGVGTYIPPELRATLGAQFIDYYARIHTFDWARSPVLTAFDKPQPGLDALEMQLNWYERVWEEDINEDVPIMRLAMAWMRANMPPVDKVSVVHGDYRTGNFLYTEHDNKITSLLDWELAHMGDRHEDIAWTTAQPFGFIGEDGKTFLVGGFMPKEAFFEAYEKASGLSINLKTMKFYEIFNVYKSANICLATGSRVARNGKTHQDILVAWLSGISYMNMNELRMHLEDVL
jgi:aminoglycoside phosphotransferase (APT) family kinase protein